MLRTILRAVAIVDGLVCLYALDPELRADPAGAPAHGRRAARQRRRRRPRSGACSPASSLALVVPGRRARASCSSGSCSARRWRTWRPATRRWRSTPASGRSLAVLAGLARGRRASPSLWVARQGDAGDASSRDWRAREPAAHPAPGLARCSAGRGAAGRRVRRRRPRRPAPTARRCAPPRATRAARASSAPVRGEPLLARTELGPARSRDRASWPRSPTSPTPTCSTPRPPPGYLPGSPRAAVSVDLPSPGDADRAGAGRRAARGPGARPRTR